MGNHSNHQLNQIIHFIRGHRVILDSDLATLYEVEPKRLNEQVKRNILRFPADFMFQLTDEEHEILRSQNATSRFHCGVRAGMTEKGSLAKL